MSEVSTAAPDNDRRITAYILFLTKHEVMRMIAAAGGFMGRKCDGQPGAKAIWSGIQALHFFVEGMRAALEMAAGKSYG
jgi:hypothetical protein